MNISLIATIVVGVIFGLFLLYWVISGLKQGLGKTLVRLGFIIVAIALSILITTLTLSFVKPILLNLLDGINFAELQELREASPSMESYIYSIASALVAPLAFVIIFEIVCLLMKIPAHFIKKIFNKKEGVEPKGKAIKKVSSAVIGAVCAVVMTACVLMPVVLYINVVGNVYTVMKENDIVIEDEMTASVLNECQETNDAFAVKTIYKTSQPMLHFLTQIKTSDGRKTTFNDEFDVIAQIIPSAMSLKDLKFDDISKIDVEPIDKLIDAVSESENLKEILAEVAKSGSSKWLEGEAFLGLNIKKDMDPDLYSAIDILLEDLAETTPTKINKDLKSLTSVITSVSNIYTTLQDMNFNEIENIDVSALNNVIGDIESNEKLPKIMAAVLKDGGTKWKNGEAFLGMKIKGEGGVDAEFNNAIDIILTDFSNTTDETVVSDLRAFTSTIDTLSSVYSNISTLDFSEDAEIDISAIDKVIADIAQDEKAKEIVAVLLNDAGTAWSENREFFGINIKENLPEGYKNSFDSTINRFKVSTKASVVTDLNSFSGSMKAYKYALKLASDKPSSEDLADSMKDFINSIDKDNAEQIKEVITPEMIQETGVPAEEAQTVSDILGSTISKIGQLEGEDKEKEANALNSLLQFITNKNGSTGGSTTPVTPGTSASTSGSTSGDTSNSGSGSSVSSGSQGSQHSSNSSQQSGSSSGSSVSGGSTSTSGGSGTGTETESEPVSAGEMLNTVLESSALSDSVNEYVAEHTEEVVTVNPTQKEELQSAINDFTATKNPTPEQQATLDAIKALFAISD